MCIFITNIYNSICIKCVAVAHHKLKLIPTHIQMCAFDHYLQKNISQTLEVTSVLLYTVILAEIKQLEVKLEKLAANFESELKHGFKPFSQH